MGKITIEFDNDKELRGFLDGRVELEENTDYEDDDVEFCGCDNCNCKDSPCISCDLRDVCIDDECMIDYLEEKCIDILNQVVSNTDNKLMIKNIKNMLIEIYLKR